MESIFTKYKNNNYIKGHILRYKKSIEYIKPYIKNGMKILNVGGEGTIIDELLSTFAKDIIVENINIDEPSPGNYRVYAHYWGCLYYWATA